MNLLQYSVPLTFSWRTALRLVQVFTVTLLAMMVVILSTSSHTYAAGPDPDGDPVPFVQPGLQIGGRSEIRLVDLGATVTCGAHYWLDVAGDVDIVDALLVRLLRADGTFFAERRAFVGFVGQLGNGSDFSKWDPKTYELVYCVDAARTTPGSGAQFCVNETPIVEGGDEWKLAWFMATYRPIIYELPTWDLLDCQTNNLYCQARVQTAARQLAVWHLIHGSVPDPNDPTGAEPAVDAAVLAVYDALLKSIPSEPPLFYTDDPLHLAIEPASDSSILPGGEAQTVRVRLTKGTANPVPLPDTTVDLKSTLGQVAPSQAQTDAEGYATFTITSKAGGTAELSATATVTVPQVIRYDASNVAATDDQAQGLTVQAPVTVTATATKTWVQTHPGISLQKTVDSASGIFSVGQEVTFTIAVRNTGDTTLVTVPITDVYDGEFLQYVRTSLSTPDVNFVDPTTLGGNPGLERYY